MTSPTLSQQSQQGQRWTDGFRGCAAVLVMISHVIRAFSPSCTLPQVDAETGPTVWQLPFIRLIGSHHVAVFFLLLGYVNVMRPLKYARQGDIAEALNGLASSSLKRIVRLVLPAIVATIGSWIVCQAGGYELARGTDSTWLGYTSPARASNPFQAVAQLGHNIFTLWTTGESIYDKNLWTMFHLLKASFYLYMVLLVTIRMTPRYRMATFAGMYALCWATGDVTAGINIFAGSFLAEWSMQSSVTLPEYSLSEKHAPPPPPPKHFRCLPILLITLGLFLCGFPDAHAEWTPWSAALEALASRLTTSSTEIWRLYPSLGAQLIVIAIILSPTLQTLLSKPWLLWLGKISFPIYLIHGTLLRSLLAWLIYSFGTVNRFTEALPTTQDQGDHGFTIDVGGEREWTQLTAPTSLWVYVVIVPIWACVVLLLADLWNKYVESWCIWATKRVEEFTSAPLI